MRACVPAVLIAASLVLAPPNLTAQSDDELLAERVRLAVADAGLGSVDVRADDGVVVLSGVVDNAREKILAIQAAFSVSDVEAVDTELRLRVGVTPEVEEEIWSNLMQEKLDAGIEEIVVENGVASISGKVSDEATRDRVLSIASRAEGVEAVTSVVVVETAAVSPKSEPEPEPVPETNADSDPPPATEPVDATEPGAEPEPIAPSKPAPAPVSDPEPEPIFELGLEPEAAEPEPEPAAEPEVPSEPEPEPEPATPAESTPAAPAVDVPRPSVRADLPQDVAKQLLGHAGTDYTVFDQVQFTLDGDVVILVGSVTTEAKKQNLEASIATVPGVARVQNELRVLSNSSEDENLRERLYRRIYEDRSFSELADGPNPPIHIIVDAKYVTLTGIVDSQILQMSAEAIVRTTFGVRGVRNQIRVRE